MISLRAPGDKSISHRALILAALSGRRSTLRGLSDGDDVRTTLAAMQALGAGYEIEMEPGGSMTARREGGPSLRSPGTTLDCGNSGTTARLLAGLLAGSGLGATLDGDASLRSRPMRRVVYPLQAMGARIEYLEAADRLPFRILPRATGGLRRLRHRGRVASAQVKSAILLAGLTGRVPVEVHEPARSRDHTERMLRAMGAPVAFDPDRSGAGAVSLDPAGWDGELGGLDLEVPGDPSAAAFLLGAALLAGREARVEGVGANPGRTGFLDVLGRMGADVEREARPSRAGEPVEDWTIRPAGGLAPFAIGGDEIPGLLDEIPLLAILAARAVGTSTLRDAAELRVKESDRLAGLAKNFGAIGVAVTELEDGLEIRGTDAPLAGRIDTEGDHRLAMAFGVLAAGGGADLDIDDPRCAAVSFPRFWETIGSLAGARSWTGSDRRVIAIDGPAASGKSTTARGVAEQMGYVHVNSGLFYRAITWWALREGLDPTDLRLARGVTELSIELVPEGAGFAVSVGGRLPGAELHGPEVAGHVSEISTLPAVRDTVLRLLRAAGEAHDLVCDGRDIGTTVFPSADLKIYLVAEAAERARRRLLESEATAGAEDLQAEVRRLEARDRTDSERALSPLRPASDAIEIDTTEMGPDAVVERIVALARERGLAPRETS